MTVRISVVIATHNRLPMLARCLCSLEAQDYDRDLFEVIVIDDGSSDGTASFLAEFVETSTLRLLLISHPNQGVSLSRNKGIVAASGEYIAFTDDDCLLPLDWLTDIDRLWAEASIEVAGVGGPLDTFTSGQNSLAATFLHYIDEFNYIPVLTDWRIRPVHVSRLRGDEKIPYLRTSNASFRKKYLVEVGGFDSAFCRPGGEDPDICYRLLKLGYCFQIAHDLIVRHHSRDSLAAYFRTVRNYIIGEIRKSSKRSQYPSDIARSYYMIPLQKLVSVALSILFLPVAYWRAFKWHKAPLSQRLSFPIIVTASKFYALYISLYSSFQR